MRFSPPARWIVQLAAPLAGICILATTVVSTERSAPPRAPRPQWPRDVVDTFFLDAREHLVGKRPEAAKAPAAGNGSTAATSQSPMDRSFVWSQLVDSDTLETEIKRIALSLQANLKSPSLFKSGGFGQCRRNFSMLAVLFAVIHQFDQDVRWKRDAAALRARFAHSGFLCQVASEDTFAEACQRRDQLLDLLLGKRSRLEKPAPLENAAEVADRNVLMQRMQQSLEQQLSPRMGNKTVFRAQAKTVGYEAQLLAMLAEWIGREGYEYWDDESYALQARLLRHAATELAVASRPPDYSRARQAASRIGPACGNCHENYRN